MDERHEVEAHLFKEAAAAAAVAGSIFAGAAQARIPEPEPDGGQTVVVNAEAVTVQKPQAHKHVKPHVRQRNRADWIDGP
jgi:hypothetical protein